MEQRRQQLHDKRDGVNDRSNIRPSYQNLPQSVVDRIFERHSRFNGLELTETDLEEILKSAASQNEIELDLSGAALNGDGGLFLADCISRYNYYSFVNLNLSSTKLSKEGFEALMYSVIEFKFLEVLYLRNNDLPKEAGLSLAKALGAKGKLRVLDIQENNLGDTGVAAIAGSFTADLRDISQNVSISLLSLQELDLSANKISDAAVLALCRGLSQCGKQASAIGRKTSLHTLRMNRNSLGDKAAMCLAQLLQTCGGNGYLSIKELSVTDNPIGFRGMIALLSTAQEGARYSLQTLNMGRCKPNLSLLEMAAIVLASPSALKVLDLSMIEPTAREVSIESGFTDTLTRLAAAVGANSELCSLNLGELPDTLKKALSASQIGSAPYQKIKDALEAMRSMQDILRLTASLSTVGSTDIDTTTSITTTSGASPQQTRELSLSTQPLLADSSLLTAPIEPHPSALEIQQREFERLQQEHTAMMDVLSSEIKRLVSPARRDGRVTHSAAMDTENDAVDESYADRRRRPTAPGHGRGGGRDLRDERHSDRDVTSESDFDMRDRSGVDGRRWREPLQDWSRGEQDVDGSAWDPEPVRVGGRSSRGKRTSDEAESLMDTSGLGTVGIDAGYSRSTDYRPRDARGGDHDATTPLRRPRSTVADRYMGSAPGSGNSYRSRDRGNRYREEGDGELRMTRPMLNDIVKSAVQEALGRPRHSSSLSSQSGLAHQVRDGFGSGGYGGASDGAVMERLTQILARMDIIQDRVQNVEAESRGYASQDATVALQRAISELENRLARLETLVDAKADQTSVLMSTSSVESRMLGLSERLYNLESAVESEHETSLQVLDVLLGQKTAVKR